MRLLRNACQNVRVPGVDRGGFECRGGRRGALLGFVGVGRGGEGKGDLGAKVPWPPRGAACKKSTSGQAAILA